MNLSLCSCWKLLRKPHEGTGPRPSSGPGPPSDNSGRLTRVWPELVLIKGGEMFTKDVDICDSTNTTRSCWNTQTVATFLRKCWHSDGVQTVWRYQGCSSCLYCFSVFCFFRVESETLLTNPACVKEQQCIRLLPWIQEDESRSCVSTGDRKLSCQVGLRNVGAGSGKQVAGLKSL